MDKYTEKAIGLIETLGMVPALYGADSMLKAADVELFSYENVGSSLVAVMVSGDVAAVSASVEAGQAAASSVGKLTASNVMPRPGQCIGMIAAVHGIEANCSGLPHALAMIETFGIVYVLEAADAMTKAADVELIGYENVASGYISVLVSGDVSACEAALAAGVKAVQSIGASVHCAVVIPSPHPALGLVIERYALEKLLP